jgi:hypothetical protein
MELIPCEKSIPLWNRFLVASMPYEGTDDFSSVILEQYMGARNRIGIGLTYIGWRNRFPGLLKSLKNSVSE